MRPVDGTANSSPESAPRFSLQPPSPCYPQAYSTSLGQSHYLYAKLGLFRARNSTLRESRFSSRLSTTQAVSLLIFLSKFMERKLQFRASARAHVLLR